MKTHKAFDCVAMKHKAAAGIHKELAGKSTRERLDYWDNERKAMEKRLNGSKRS